MFIIITSSIIIDCCTYLAQSAIYSRLVVWADFQKVPHVSLLLDHFTCQHFINPGTCWMTHGVISDKTTKSQEVWWDGFPISVMSYFCSYTSFHDTYALVFHISIPHHQALSRNTDTLYCVLPYVIPFFPSSLHDATVKLLDRGYIWLCMHAYQHLTSLDTFLILFCISCQYTHSSILLFDRDSLTIWQSFVLTTILTINMYPVVSPYNIIIIILLFLHLFLVVTSCLAISTLQMQNISRYTHLIWSCPISLGNLIFDIYQHTCSTHHSPKICFLCLEPGL